MGLELGLGSALQVWGFALGDMGLDLGWGQGGERRPDRQHCRYGWGYGLGDLGLELGWGQHCRYGVTG